MTTTSPTDRAPPLELIVRPADLERTLRPLLAWDLELVALFDRQGAVFSWLAAPATSMSLWESLPPEALASLRGGRGAFAVGDRRFEVRTCHAGAERVAYAVYGGVAEVSREALATRADAIGGVLAALLQAGFAAWVTSELHLATSQSNFAALEHQNRELARAVEHLRQLDSLKSNFLATVSHELRTPLTSIIGFADLLLQGIAGDLSPEQREHVQTIFERGEELYRLITQILEMSRMEAGTMRLSLEPASVGELAQRAFDAVAIAARQGEVELRCELPEGLPEVLADRDRVQQILVNLVGNAIKFRRDPAVVTITAAPAPIRRPFDEEDFFGAEVADAVRITVRDNGIGIAEDQVQRIFEAFYQVDASATREHGGAGLGLSIVQKLVTAHGGEIWVESTVGEQTSFHFTLPVASSAARSNTAGSDGDLAATPKA